MTSLLNIFGKERAIVIGVIHFPPLLGANDAQSIETARANALHDLHAFEKGGVDAIIIENNYDLPHLITILPETQQAMIELGHQIRSATKLPIGVCVLWNDYQSSFAVATAIDAQFIRIPVFVDRVQTDFGKIEGSPDNVLAVRKELAAEHIKILADVHVKHATILSENTVAEAAKLAHDQGADGIIVTGKWTGDAPTKEDLHTVREAIGNTPLFAGSGVDTETINSILHDVNGVIVSTSLKQGDGAETERNVKGWTQRIDSTLVQQLIQSIHHTS